MLGRATVTLTLDTYSPLVPVLRENAAAAMDAMLNAQRLGGMVLVLV